MLRLLFALFLLLASGCTPRLAPLYTDLDASAVQAGDTSVQYRAARALEAAGWTLTSPPAVGSLATDPRRMSDWGLYRVYLSVEVLPLGDSYVRVLFHPYRQYITGGRGKILYLPGGVKRAALPPLKEALEAHGFSVVLSGERADRAARRGTVPDDNG